MSADQGLSTSRQSIRGLEATNFFVADIQTGLGPFLAAYLASAGWHEARVGFALTVGGVISVALQTPAGALVDRVRAKRLLVCLAAAVLAVGAIILSRSAHPVAVYGAELLIGAAGPFLGPTLAALTLGLVGTRGFDRQFGKNQAFNSAGNVASALLVAWVSHRYGNRAIFWSAAMLAAPTMASVLLIRGGEVDFNRARGASGGDEDKGSRGSVMLRTLLEDRVLLSFLVCAFLFHFANAAMLPQLGEMLARGRKASAAPFMAACILVTQVVITFSAAPIGRLAGRWGRKPLLLAGFTVLPVRGMLYTVIHNTAGLIAVQTLDGVANAIFGVVSVLVVADLTRGTGRFNLVQGMLATAVGLGAALSTTFGGALIGYGGYRLSFLSLAAVASAAVVLLATIVPETLARGALSHGAR